MINVRKKDKETSESLIRRFSRRVQQSRILMQARKARFQEEEKSKAEKRKEALYKIKIKKEIDKLTQKEEQKGLTIIPLSVYNKGNKIKIELAVVKGKKKYDHREDIKKKDMKRDSDREMKGVLKK